MTTFFISCTFSFQAHLVEIALSVPFLFCFVFQHIAKQEEAHVLPANRVVQVPVLYAPASPASNQVSQLFKTKKVPFFCILREYPQQAQNHPSQVIGAQEESANLKETGEGSSMAFSSGQKREGHRAAIWKGTWSSVLSVP